MPFIGTTPAQGFASVFNKQTFTANGSTTSFTLNHRVNNANDLEVFVGNVRQEPTEAYSASALNLTMTEAPANGVSFYVIYKGLAQVTTSPSDGSVGVAQLQNNAITNAKIATGIDASKLTTGSLPIAQGGTGRTAELHSAWVMSPQISSPSGSTGLMQWAKDAASTTDNLNGTDVTMSSGVITFPSTGLYKLTVDMQGRQSSSSVTYVGFTWEHSSDSGGSYSTVWRRLTNSISGGYFAFVSDFYYNVTNISTQRLKALHYATALSGLVIDGGQGYTSTRLYITKVS